MNHPLTDEMCWKILGDHSQNTGFDDMRVAYDKGYDKGRDDATGWWIDAMAEMLSVLEMSGRLNQGEAEELLGVFTEDVYEEEEQ